MVRLTHGPAHMRSPESRVACPDDRLTPVGDLNLDEDVGEVVGHGLDAEAQFFGNCRVVAAAGQANLDAEQRKLQDNVNKLKAYPIIKIGYSFSF